MRLTHEQRIVRLKMSIAANLHKFDEQRDLRQDAKCRAIIRQDRVLRKRFEHLVSERRTAQ
jgi:hypothetical protein